MSARDAPVWRLASPAERPGAIAIIQIRGDVDDALARAGIAPVGPGQVGLRSLAGVDRGVVARVKDGLAIVMPHGGMEVVRQLGAALTAAGIAHDGDRSAGAKYPEARSGVEAALFDALARAASPRAIDLLLSQPGLWARDLGREPTLDETDPDPARSARLARLILPPMVVAVGASNIGKSTLLNRLSGRAVAGVADEPGTTRDHLGSLVDLDGLIVRWVDTPGRRPEADDAEREAVEIADALLPAADLVVRLGDRDHDPVGGSELRDRAVATIALRSDLGLPAWEHDAAVSAATGEGIGDLTVLLRRRLVRDEDLAGGVLWRFWD